MLLSTYDFEADTNGQPIAPTAPWGTTAGTTPLTTHADAAIHGTLGGRITDATSSQSLEYVEDATNDTRVLDFYITPRTINGNTYIAALRHQAASTTRADMRLSGARTLTIRNGNVATATGTTPLDLDITYRIAWRTSTTGQEARIYVGESPTPIETLTGALTDPTHDRIRVGLPVAAAGAGLDIDTVRVATDWLDPYAASPAPTGPIAHLGTVPITAAYLGSHAVMLHGMAPSSPPANAGIWWSHHDNQIRPGYDVGFDGFEQAMRDASGHNGPGHIGTFVRGYSGSNFPATFQASSVSHAPNLGLGAMINVKRGDWAALARGDYDSTIQSFFNSWPTETFGSFTINHEPENDNPTGAANPSNPDYVAWASVQGPIWSQGIARTIAVAAPIIRARGLDVKLGGCLMDFSWDTTRWTYWDWWNYVDPDNFDVVEYQIDGYCKTNVINGQPVGAPLIPRLLESFADARALGISAYSIFETANDRRLRNGGDTLVGTDESVATWWESFPVDLAAAIPETRAVGYFSIPTGPASGQAGIMGRGLDVFADICLGGRRP